jgi:hypothetical protein
LIAPMRAASLVLAVFLSACGGAATGTDSPTSPSPETSDPDAAGEDRDEGAPAPAAADAPPSTPEAATPAPEPGTTDAAGEGDQLPFTTGGTGKLPAATIKKVVRSRMPGYIECYQKALETAPDLAGKVALRFRIEPSGKVGEVEPRGAGVKKQPAFAACLRDQVAGLTFPRPKGGPVEVVYPLAFAAE